MRLLVAAFEESFFWTINFVFLEKCFPKAVVRSYEQPSLCSSIIFMMRLARARKNTALGSMNALNSERVPLIDFFLFENW